MEKIQLEDLYPPRRDGSFHQLKDDGGGLTSSISVEKKYRCRSSPPVYPPRREETGLRQRDDGGGLTIAMSKDLDQLKKYGARTSTPEGSRPAEEIWRQDLYPPAP
jgi:hypothetical protein